MSNNEPKLNIHHKIAKILMGDNFDFTKEEIEKSATLVDLINVSI